MAPVPDKIIILLVGPKGAGKTHIGMDLARMFDADFLRVEKIWQDMSPDKMEFDSPAFMAEGIRRTLVAVSERLARHNAIILESSGAFDLFPDYLTALRAMGRVCLVSVRAPIDQCLLRIRTRDQSLHVPVPEDDIVKLNQRSERTEMEWDIVISNHPFISSDELKKIFSPFLIIPRAIGERDAQS